MATFAVSGSGMLCHDFDVRVCVDPKAHGYFGSTFAVSGSGMLCHDFDVRVCVDPKAHGYFGSICCQWFWHVVS